MSFVPRRLSLLTLCAAVELTTTWRLKANLASRLRRSIVHAELWQIFFNEGVRKTLQVFRCDIQIAISAWDLLITLVQTKTLENLGSCSHRQNEVLTSWQDHATISNCLKTHPAKKPRPCNALQLPKLSLHGTCSFLKEQLSDSPKSFWSHYQSFKLLFIVLSSPNLAHTCMSILSSYMGFQNFVEEIND